jgi:hypothetical protein
MIQINPNSFWYRTKYLYKDEKQANHEISISTLKLKYECNIL